MPGNESAHPAPNASAPPNQTPPAPATETQSVGTLPLPDINTDTDQLVTYISALVLFGILFLAVRSLLSNWDEVRSKTSHFRTATSHIVYAAILLVGIICILLAPNVDGTGWTKYLKLILENVGTSAIVACILIYTVELISKRNHEAAAQQAIDSIKLDVFKAIYNRYIPEIIFNQVEKALMSSKAYRTSYNVQYDLLRLPEHEKKAIDPNHDIDHIRCVIKSSYDLHNTTDESHEFPIELHLEYPLEDSLRKFVRLTDLYVDNKRVPVQDLPGHVQPDLKEGDIGPPERDTHYRFKYPVHLPANGSVSINMHMETIKRSTDIEVWASRMPADGLNLTVRAPKDIHVQASANHTEALQVIPTPIEGETQWTLSHGMFPFQSVLFWWDLTPEAKAKKVKEKELAMNARIEAAVSAQVAIQAAQAESVPQNNEPTTAETVNFG